MGVICVLALTWDLPLLGPELLVIELVHEDQRIAERVEEFTTAAASLGEWASVWVSQPRPAMAITGTARRRQ